MKEDRLGPTQLYPKCGRQNASGFNLPEQCMWCKRKSYDTFTELIQDSRLRRALEQKPLPPEFSETVDKHFWELV